MGVADRPWSFILANAISKVGMGLRMASVGTLQARISTALNRGAVFSTVSMFQQLGGIIGPIAGGYIAADDAKQLLWYVAGCMCLASAAILQLIDTDPKDDETSELAEPLLAGETATK